VDDYRTSGPGRRGDDPTVGKGRTPDSDPAYDWGGQPGEDFGPMPAPPGAAPISLPASEPVTPREASAAWPTAPEQPAAEQLASDDDAPVWQPTSEPAPGWLRSSKWNDDTNDDPSLDDDDNTASLPRPEQRFGRGVRADEWTRTAPVTDRAHLVEQHTFPGQPDTGGRAAGPTDPWNAPPAAMPIDVDVDDATSVRRSVGRGSVPLGARQPRGRPFAGLLALLVVLGLLVGVVLAVLSRQNAPATQSLPSASAPAAGTASPGTGPGLAILPIATSTVAQAGPSPVLTFTPEAVVLDEPTPDAPVTTTPAAASPEPTLTPLVLGPPSGSPPPGATRAAPTPRAVVRASPGAVVPGVPPLVTPPPGVRFPTSTPIRAAAPTRTPPPIPTVRPLTFYTRIWSEQTLHRQGDDATICGQANTGASAEMFVLGPDRATTSLGQFTPPAERVCTTLKLDTTGLYVLTLIVKDAGGTETDRQSAALYVGR
jgi:hypothetical protein